MQDDGHTHNNTEQGNYFREDRTSFIYDYDAEQEAERWLDEFSKRQLDSNP
jgi:hypothetical protein